MENKNKVATVGEGGVSAKQTESHNEAINDNRDGCRFVVVYRDSEKFIYYCSAKINWIEGDTTVGHYLTELPISEFNGFVSDTNPVLIQENFF